MIVVTGAPRSGTSLWMQAFESAGRPVFGEPFPPNTKGLERFNRRGYWESAIRQGINWETNPHRGRYLHPNKAKGIVVKLIGDAIVRTELGFIERAIHAIRKPGDMIASLKRLDEAAGHVRREPYWALWSRSVASVLIDAHMRGYDLIPAEYERVADPGYVDRVIGFSSPVDIDKPRPCVSYDGPHTDEIQKLHRAALANELPSDRIIKLTRAALAGADVVRAIFDGAPIR